jgi:Xaa-Pro dipeptidase
MLEVTAIQQTMRDYGLDGWLFYDVWHRDPLCYRILGLDSNQLTTRRWFYLIPCWGTPTKLVHRNESTRLASLPGETFAYSRWQELHHKLAEMLTRGARIAMQYSPNNDLFNVSYVDAGTLDLIRSMGVEVISSADLIQRFVSRVDGRGVALHKEAGRKVQSIKDYAFQLIFDAVRSGRTITELDVQNFILGEFANHGLTSEGLKPVVASNSHAANPHFEVTPATNVAIKEGDTILIDLWAKIDDPAGIYYDITWCGYIGREPPVQYESLFSVVVEARNLASAFVAHKLSSGERIYGWQVDDVCRSHVEAAGYGDYFTHRTGHSIDTSVHGSGVNIDNYETRDYREIIPGICFSIEPGIYIRDLGVRSEIDLLIDEFGQVHIYGAQQDKLLIMR